MAPQPCEWQNSFDMISNIEYARDVFAKSLRAFVYSKQPNLVKAAKSSHVPPESRHSNVAHAAPTSSLFFNTKSMSPACAYRLYISARGAALLYRPY
jgi:hypothetical protein